MFLKPKFQKTDKHIFVSFSMMLVLYLELIDFIFFDLTFVPFGIELDWITKAHLKKQYSCSQNWSF